MSQPPSETAVAAFKAACKTVVAPCARKGSCYEYELDTNAGLLHIAFHDFWIAMRFADIPRAQKELPEHLRKNGMLNPHSGKWNMMFSDRTDLDTVKFCLRERLLVIGTPLDVCRSRKRT